MKSETKNHFFSTILLLLVSFQMSYAQNNYCTTNYDSLANQLNKPQTNAEKVKLLMLLVDLKGDGYPTEKFIEYLHQLILYNKQANLIDIAPYETMLEGYSAWQISDLQGALNALKKAVALFNKQQKVILPLLLTVRLLYNQLNQQEERYKFYKENLDYYLINGPTENMGPCYHGIAGYYTYQADYNSAISNYLRAASVFKNFCPSYYLNEIGVVGELYSEWGNDEKAIQYLKKYITLSRVYHDSVHLQNGLKALSQLVLKDRKYNEAIQLSQETLVIAKKDLSNPVYAIITLQNGFIYLEEKQPALAYPFLHEAKRLRDSLFPQIYTLAGALEIDFALYRYYHLINNDKLAERYLVTAFTKATDEKSQFLQLKYLKELSIFYEKQKPVLALQYTRRYLKLNDSLQQGQNKFKVSQYENEEKELEQNKRVYALRQERAIQEATLSKRNIILGISLGALILICSALIFLYRQFRINRKTLLTLRNTQRQLILSEKMASLGELTAGIAHEIQNPLNFVNNFSEVNKEMLEELKAERLKPKAETDEQAQNEIINDLIANEEKINFHGKRADSIVKGMLQHSRVSTGHKEPTDINALADEYLRLSYHGMRAKDKNFNAAIHTDFDTSIDKINVVPQDMGRVLLNLFNNAFYAVSERQKIEGAGYEPVVSVSTKKENDKMIITVRDNGIGIPQKVIDKIFQPFFTTKPTGQGTGLGLSLSYDIVKVHGGEIKVDSKEREGSEFVIQLPI